MRRRRQATNIVQLQKNQLRDFFSVKTEYVKHNYKLGDDFVYNGKTCTIDEILDFASCLDDEPTVRLRVSSFEIYSGNDERFKGMEVCHDYDVKIVNGKVTNFEQI